MALVKGPASRGFSFIEIWMVGMQIPILVGILEYAFLLMRKKYQKCSEPNAKNIDRLTHIGCLIYIISFIVILNQVEGQDRVKVEVVGEFAQDCCWS